MLVKNQSLIDLNHCGVSSIDFLFFLKWKV